MASHGYRWDGRLGRFENLAFFPAYPLALGTTARALGLSSQVAWNWLGCVLSSAFFVGALYCLRAWVALRADESASRVAVAACVTYPFGIYFGLPYTESLYLLVSIGAFLAFERHHYAVATGLGALAGLTRPSGVTLSPVLLLLACGVQHRRSRPAALLASAGPVLGVGVFSAFVYGLTGNPWAWAEAQEGWGRVTQSPVSAVTLAVAQIARHPASMLASEPHVVLNTFACVATLLAIVPIGRTVGAPYAVLTLLGVLMPLAGGGIASMGRYTSVLFPIYAAVALAVPRGLRPVVLVCFALAQVGVAALFFTWRPMY